MAKLVTAPSICIRCLKRPRLPGKTNCRECTDYKKYYCQGRYDIRKLKGLCVVCGGKFEGIYLICMKCRELKSKQYHEAKNRRQNS
jgi:DNA polymerase II large subunit